MFSSGRSGTKRPPASMVIRGEYGLVVSPQSNLDHSLSAIGRFLTVSGHCQGTGGISIRYKSFWILGLLQIRTSMNSRLAQLSVSQRGLKGLSGKTFLISIHNIFIHLE